jgi:hypothetical protein
MNKSKGFSGSHVIRDSFRSMVYFQRSIKDDEGKNYTNELLELRMEKNNDARSGYTMFNVWRTKNGALMPAPMEGAQLDAERKGSN